MSEEEIIKNINLRLEKLKGNKLDKAVFNIADIKDLFNLYNEEKEKNKDLITMYLLQKDLFNDFSLDYISKNKIRGKIEQYKKMMDKLNKAKDIDRIKSINERIIALKEILGE